METVSISRNSSSLIILTRLSTRHKSIFLPQRHTFNPIRCTTTDNNNKSSSSNSSSSNTTNDDANSVQVQAATATPTNPVEISFRRRSRRQAKRLRENENSGMQKARVDTPPKKWEDMSLSEKAVELYVGEKGALFWLNKFAYASIFIMIGGWIAFRFVGPAFNLYQLDGPLLSPSDVFK